MSSNLSPIETAVYDLVRRYIERQETARDALKEVRPDALFYHDKDATGEMVAAMVQAHMHKTSGEWHDWDFTIIDKGIRLVHRTTQEPIEWEAPDVNTFQRDALLNWAEWYLGQPSSADLLLIFAGGLGDNQVSLTELVFPTLNRFVRLRIMHQKNTTQAPYQYTMGKN